MKQFKNIKVGDKIPVWWKTNEIINGQFIATILDIKEYKGRYDFVNCILVLTAPNCEKGTLEMSYNTDDFDYDQRRMNTKYEDL